jgi:hypothetical protein
MSRRRFLEGALGLCLLTAGCSPTLLKPAEPNAKVLNSLAEVVLPSGLSIEQRRRAVASFWKWAVGYRTANRRLRPWGFPVQVKPRYHNHSDLVLFYSRQLDELSWAAGAAFVSLSGTAREQLVRDALSGAPAEERLLPWPTALVGTELHHVSLALVSHFLYSAAGRNFAQGRDVDPFQCRSLSGVEEPPS